jgi:hypothetical protein
MGRKRQLRGESSGKNKTGTKEEQMLIYVVSQKQVDKFGSAWRAPECGANLWFNDGR